MQEQGALLLGKDRNIQKMAGYLKGSNMNSPWKGVLCSKEEKGLSVEKRCRSENDRKVEKIAGDQ